MPAPARATNATGDRRPVPVRAEHRSLLTLTESDAGWRADLVLDPEALQASGLNPAEVRRLLGALQVHVRPNLVPGTPFEVREVIVAHASAPRSSVRSA